MPIPMSGAMRLAAVYIPTESVASSGLERVVGKTFAGGDTSSAFAEILWKSIVGNRGGDEWIDNAVDGRSVCSCTLLSPEPKRRIEHSRQTHKKRPSSLYTTFEEVSFSHIRARSF